MITISVKTMRCVRGSHFSKSYFKRSKCCIKLHHRRVFLNATFSYPYSLSSISRTTDFCLFLLIVIKAFLFPPLLVVFSARYGSPKRQLQFYRYPSVSVSAVAKCDTFSFRFFSCVSVCNVCIFLYVQYASITSVFCSFYSTVTTFL